MEGEIKRYISEDFSNFNIDKKYDKILIISDENVGKLYIDELKKYIENCLQYIIPYGENSKCLEIFENIFEFCLENNVSRKSLIIALGGGVVGDLSGFVASTYMRGIDYIQVPTTLLAQVDSSIGGKCGINLGNYKNVIGSFYHAKFTYFNISVLKTLPKDDFLSGLCEVIKYGFIRDYNFLNYLIENKDGIVNLQVENLKYIVKKCTDIKVDVVSEDEKESNVRQILNLGHSFGHPIEKMFKISHGKSIAIGTCVAFRLSLNENLIDNDYYEEAINIYKCFNIDMKIPKLDVAEMVNLMRKDKKNNYNKFNLVLPTGKGEVGIFDIKEENIIRAIKDC